MSRSLALLITGAWLATLLASWAMATVHFRTVDRVLGPSARGEVGTKLAPIPVEDRRMVLRHLVSEINRAMFRRWAVVQLVLGVTLVGLLWPSGGVPRGLSLAALAIVVVQALGLAPAIATLGRSVDFLPRPLSASLGRRFGILHACYVGSDIVKAVLLTALAFSVGKRT